MLSTYPGYKLLLISHKQRLNVLDNVDAFRFNKRITYTCAGVVTLHSIQSYYTV